MKERDEPSLLKEPDLSGTYTAKDYLQWQLDELVELIRGKIFKMSPSPTSNHQKISVGLLDQFLEFFRGKECQVFHAPLDVYLIHRGEDVMKTKNIVEPDLCVICDASKIKKFGCVGSPDLVVEILSPSTSKKDTKLKYELYEEYGVKEYWIVSPEKRNAVVYVLKNEKYQVAHEAVVPAIIRSEIFPQLEVDLGKVFRRVN